MTHHHHGNTIHSHLATTTEGHSDLGEHDCSQYNVTVSKWLLTPYTVVDGVKVETKGKTE